MSKTCQSLIFLHCYFAVCRSVLHFIGAHVTVEALPAQAESLWSDSIAFPWSTLIWFDSCNTSYCNTWTSDSMAVSTHKFIKCFGMYKNFRLNGYVYSWMYFFVKFGMFWYTLVYCWNCLYIRRVTLPLAKTPHKPDANFIIFFWCMFMVEYWKWL